MIKGRGKFEILLVRSKKGIIISDEMNPIHAFIIILATPDQKNFYLHSLMWIVQLVGYKKFEEKWILAKDDDELKSIILDAWKEQKEEF
jgi:mannitol/fructose-specific phosphotransferase system IIA component (Ntr-type)